MDEAASLKGPYSPLSLDDVDYTTYQVAGSKSPLVFVMSVEEYRSTC